MFIESMGDLKQYLLLARYQRKMGRSRLKQLLGGSKLMVLTLGVFLLGYAFFGYLIFDRGLDLLAKAPSFGNYLADRIIFLIFFFFSVMLVFSIGVTNYIGLIKGREIGWLLTQPISHRVIFLWKSTEAIIFASWGLVFICAPLLVAYATSRDAPGIFYLKATFVLIPFVIITAGIGNTLFLSILRWAPKRFGLILGVIVLGGMCMYGYQAYRDVVKAQGFTVGQQQFKQLLEHTEISRHPMSPGMWLSHSLTQWTRKMEHNVGLHVAQLWSTALMGILVMSWLGKSWFYGGWNRSLSRAATAASRRRDRASKKVAGWVTPPKRSLISRPMRAVIRKDFLCFVREPSQWVQFVIVFGLLFVYVLNLRNLGYDIENPFWAAIISYINLTVSSLALSTLTTRFVFPMFSLEGTRLWILGMSPLGLNRVVIQKWVQAVIFTGTLTTGLQLLSGWMLGLSRTDILFFSSAVGLMSMGLCGIAVGLGALFPNLKETNAAKIVSGFGGTLCLIVSFCYIGTLVSILCLAKLVVFKTKGLSGHVSGTEGLLGLSVACAIVATIIFGGVPMFLAMRRVKRLQMLGPLQ